MVGREPKVGHAQKQKNHGKHPFLDVEYCQFSGWGYQKPTRIWCCEKKAQLASVVCDKRTCLNIDSAEGGTGRHRVRLGGNSMGSRLSKMFVPPALVDYLLSAPHFSIPPSSRLLLPWVIS